MYVLRDISYVFFYTIHSICRLQSMDMKIHTEVSDQHSQLHTHVNSESSIKSEFGIKNLTNSISLLQSMINDGLKD